MESTDNKALLFIPDISGFTKFITETEISHSQHIIQELLELLVDADIIGLNVSEFEGDAIFFYRYGASPQVDELAEQARKMFVNFHTHLKKYETHRLCQCGACKTAHNLTLKVIAHYGEASGYKVKEHEKLIGKDVITVHRLLKNSVPHNEYILLTENILSEVNNNINTNGWFNPVTGEDSYDEIGKVSYRYSALSDLLSEVKIEKPEELNVDKPLKVYEDERIINKPMEEVYNICIDFSQRTNWVAGVKEIKLFDKGLNQAGTRHLCIMEKGPNNDLITANLKVSDDEIEFWEVNVKKIAGCRYMFKRMDDNQCKVKVEFYIKDNFMLKMMFKMMMAKKLKAAFETTFNNLKKYCESKL